VLGGGLDRAPLPHPRSRQGDGPGRSAGLRAPAAWAVAAWFAGSLAVGLWQAARVARFRRQVRRAAPAPAWLARLAKRVGRRLGARAPEIRVAARPGGPLLWCLGRPVLLVPADLVKALEARRWRGILAHELAHLRRADPWVSRLELAAGVLWWWSPLYWLARRRLDREAELACDAWVVWALPGDRLTYAESLLRVCAALSPAGPPAPSLGAAGAGRFFERRLTMILNDRVACRLSPPAAIAAALLAALALPSWTTAAPTLLADDRGRASAASAATEAEGAPRLAPTAGVAAAGPADTVVDDGRDNQVADQDRDDPDDDTPEARKRAKEKAKVKTKRAAPEGDDRPEAEADKARRFGPEFEREMEALGERLGREMERRFGPGSDFEKRMRALGKEMEEKFGPGSDFEKKMRALGEKLGKELEAKFGPGSDFEKKMKPLEKAEPDRTATREKARPEAKAKAGRPAAREKARPEAGRRSQRIRALEARIKELTEELRRLKAEEEEGGEDDRG
jgi:hypothetical protein